jgi:excisionase family DNA binding protein
MKEVIEALLLEVRSLRELVERRHKPSGFNLKDAAREVGLGLSTLKELIRKQVILTVKVGRRRLVPMSEIEKFLQVHPDERMRKTRRKSEGEKIRAALKR